MVGPQLAWSDRYLYYLPEGHRFPITKYELVKQQLLHEGTIEEDHLYDAGLVEEEIILRTHTEDYWQRLKALELSRAEVRKIGLPITEISVNRARNSVAGTVTSAYNALRSGVGMNLAGGTHHAYADHGEGFCALNDIAIAANELLHEKIIKQVLIIDLDVHQGNGTATIFQDEPRVFTFSMHGEKNYPLKKEKSDLDIPLPQGTRDQEYLENVKSHVPRLLEEVRPDIVFYQSGVDILHNDKLGRLSVSKEGCKNRDELVIDYVQNADIPLVITMGGGYSDTLKDLVEAHCNTFRTAIDRYFY